MARQRRAQRPVAFRFPADFPQRLVRFKEAGGLTWRSLARLLGVSPYRLRRWRQGTAPDSTRLFLLLTVAEGMGLRDGILMYADLDMPCGDLNAYGDEAPGERKPQLGV